VIWTAVPADAAIVVAFVLALALGWRMRPDCLKD
jgi:hypothetical protein